MTTNTKNAIVAIMATDTSISPEQRDAALAALSGTSVASCAPLRPLVKPREVQRLFGVNRTTVFNLARAGVITAVRAPGHKRTTGYTRESVERYLKGL